MCEINKEAFCGTLIHLNFVSAGGEVHDRGGSSGSVHQPSSGAGERREVQGGREVKIKKQEL